MNTNFDFYTYIHSNFSSPYSVLINHEGKNQIINRYFKEVTVLYAIPVFFGLAEIAFLSCKYTNLSNKLGMLRLASIGGAMILHGLRHNKLKHDLVYFDYTYPLPTKAQDEFQKSNDIGMLKH